MAKRRITNAKTTAVLRYGLDGGSLAGRGYVAEFVKKDNKWEMIRDDFEWMS